MYFNTLILYIALLYVLLMYIEPINLADVDSIYADKGNPTRRFASM